MPACSRPKPRNLIAFPNQIEHKTSHSSAHITPFPANAQSPPVDQPSLTTALAQFLKQRPTLCILRQIHAQIVTRSFSSHRPLISSLIHCYLHCRTLNPARILFANYPFGSPPTLLWNLMIRAHSNIPDCSLSFDYFARMIGIGRDSMVVPDEYTYTFVITSCSHQVTTLQGETVHGLAIKYGLGSGLFAGNSLINMYCAFGELRGAYKVFNEMPDRDVFSWTSLLGGHMKQGDIDKAFEVFNSMPVRNDVSWAVMIAGLVAKEKYIEALDCFRGMLSDDEVKPNEAAIVCALSAGAHLGALDHGNWIHEYADRNGLSGNPNICTALIDMYIKCGRLDCATRVFNGISRRNVHNFTSMISGLSVHGLGKEALQVFSQMLAENVKPNEITILGVLNGCSHSGLLEEGTSVFNVMKSLWGITPSREHYGCYIDMLSRAGYLEMAFGFAKTMLIEADIVIWRALLSGCRMHHNIGLGEQIIQYVRQLESSGHKNGQVLLFNLYAFLGNWESVGKVRELIGKRTDTSDVGRSWIEVNGVVHEFRVDDHSHPLISEMLSKLHEVLIKGKCCLNEGSHI